MKDTVNIYAIYDEKAEQYNAPFPLATDGLAKRAFTEACQDSRTDLYKYPGDFTLYCIATWNDCTGRYENIVPVRFIAKNVRQLEKTSTEIEIEKIEKMIETGVEQEVNKILEKEECND